MQDSSFAVAPRYVFRWVDRAGQVRVRAVYWQRLHAFLFGRRKVLAALRAAPYGEELFALYLALKGRPRPAQAERPPAPAPATASIVRDLGDLLARRESSLPAELREEAEGALVQAVEETLAPHAPALDAMERAGLSAEPERRTSRLAGLLGGLHGDDIGPVQLGFQVGATIRERIRGIVEERSAAVPGGAALALRRDLERELQRELYRDPRYMHFVQWSMEASGGFVSPVVRDFLLFSYRALVARVQEASEGEGFARERLEALLGDAEAEASQTLPYYEVAVLGYLAEGSLPVDEEDPWHTHHSYQVSRTADLSEVVLAEVGRRAERTLLNAVIRGALRANIKRIRYVGAADPRRRSRRAP